MLHDKVKKNLEEKGWDFSSDYLDDEEIAGFYEVVDATAKVISEEMKHEEQSKEPIENALYATKRFLTSQASDLAEDILQYLKEAGYIIIKL